MARNKRPVPCNKPGCPETICYLPRSKGWSVWCRSHTDEFEAREVTPATGDKLRIFQTQKPYEFRPFVEQK